MFGLNPRTDPWLCAQIRRSVRTWGEHVEARLRETDLEPYMPSKEAMRPVPRYDVAAALHLSSAESAWGDEGGVPEPTGADVGALLEGLRGKAPVA
jgi:hypothetical protein